MNGKKARMMRKFAKVQKKTTDSYASQSHNVKARHVRYNPETGEIDSIVKDTEKLQVWNTANEIELYKIQKKVYNKQKTLSIEEVDKYISTNNKAVEATKENQDD